MGAPSKRKKYYYSLQRMSTIQILRPDIDWNDDDRVNALYSPFRSRDLNPESYDAKMQFWIEAIHKWAECKQVYKFKPSQILADFTANSRKPLCFQDVLLHLRESSKEISEIKDFKKSLADSWSSKLIKAAGSYIYSTLSPTSREQKRKESLEMTFIHHKMLEKQARSLLSTIKDMGLDNYCQKCDIEDVDEDTDFLLDYLRHSAAVDMRDVDGEVYIKTKAPFNDSDVAIIKLKITIDQLEKNIAEIDHKIREKKMELKNCIVKGERSKAKLLLRQKKRLDSDVLKKSNTLDNLNQVLQAIKDAQDNAKVLRSLKQAKDVLFEELKEVDVSKVDDIIDEIKEYVEKNEDVSEALSQTVQDNISGEDLEKELKQLLEDENEQDLEKALAALVVSDETIEENPAGEEFEENSKTNTKSTAVDAM